MGKTIAKVPTTSPTKSPRFGWVNLEVLAMNKWLFVSWLVAVVLFAGIHSIGVNNFSLAGMTENKAHIINYSQPVIVDKVLIQSGQKIKKGDVLFYLLRPDLTILEKKNTAELRQAVVEMNILSNRSFSVEKWKSLLNQKAKGVGLGRPDMSPQELHFLALVEMLDFNKEEQKN